MEFLYLRFEHPRIQDGGLLTVGGVGKVLTLLTIQERLCIARQGQYHWESTFICVYRKCNLEMFLQNKETLSKKTNSIILACCLVGYSNTNFWQITNQLRYDRYSWGAGKLGSEYSSLLRQLECTSWFWDNLNFSMLNPHRYLCKYINVDPTLIK